MAASTADAARRRAGDEPRDDPALAAVVAHIELLRDYRARLQALPPRDYDAAVPYATPSALPPAAGEAADTPVDEEAEAALAALDAFFAGRRPPPAANAAATAVITSRHSQPS